jgi:hypothetical protein
MELIISRTYPFIDAQSLVEHHACDSLFRTADGAFLLHMSSSDSPTNDARLLWIDCRAALIWNNAAAEEFGMEWQ